MTKRILNFIALGLATGFGVAYLTPFAKATLASAVTVAVYATASSRWVDGYYGLGIMLIVPILVIFFVGVAVSAHVKTDDDPDPSRVVIDEVAGQLAAMLLLPIEWWLMLAAFLLFRLFDIVKPLGIRRLEAIPNGWGIMLDDLAAGLLAAVVINAAILIANLVI